MVSGVCELEKSKTANPALSRETVFIVEDDASTREALGELIRPTGAKVVAFESAEAFLSGFEPEQNSCLLVDHNLPGMSGSDLLYQLRALGVTMPAVMVTAFATTPVTVDAMQMGAVDVLEKPCCDNVLLDAIGKALAHDRKQLRKTSAQQDSAARIEQLSPSEREVLVQVLEGVPNKFIARQLGVCVRTVEARRSRIYRTMDVKSVAELARACIAAGFIEA